MHLCYKDLVLYCPLTIQEFRLPLSNFFVILVKVNISDTKMKIGIRVNANTPLLTITLDRYKWINVLTVTNKNIWPHKNEEKHYKWHYSRFLLFALSYFSICKLQYINSIFIPYFYSIVMALSYILKLDLLVKCYSCSINIAIFILMANKYILLIHSM